MAASLTSVISIVTSLLVHSARCLYNLTFTTHAHSALENGKVWHSSRGIWPLYPSQEMLVASGFLYRP